MPLLYMKECMTVAFLVRHLKGGKFVNYDLPSLF